MYCTLFIIFAHIKTEKPIHIFYLPSWYPSAEQPLNGVFCRDLAELLGYDWPVTVIRIDFENNRRQMQVEQAEPGIWPFTEIKVLLPRHSGLSGFFRNQWNYYVALFRLIRQFKDPEHCHVVHAQVAWKCGFDAWLLKKRFGIHYVLTEHNTGWLPADGSLKGWKRRLSVWTLRGAGCVVAVSGGLARALKQAVKRDVDVVPNVIHPVFSSAEVQPAPADPTFLHISNFREHHKQTGRIISAFNLLLADVPHAKLLLNVPEQPFLDFRKMHPDYRWDRIILLPPVDDRSELAARMAAATCVVSFSRFETFGLTLAEALCTGVPVIYTPCGGADELFTPDVGVACDPDSDDELLEAMRKMAGQDAFNRTGIAQKARSLFGAAAVTQAYGRMYRELTA